MTKRILVTPRSATRGGHPSLEQLRAAGFEVVFCQAGVQPSEGELCALLSGCVGYLAGVEPVTARVFESAPQLRVISRNGTGVDNIDLAAAQSRGVVVVRAEGANARGVAELTIGCLFALARGIAPADAALKRDAWTRGSAGVELEAKTLGLIGCGRIGKLVARMALGIGMEVIAFDPTADEQFEPGAGFRRGSFEEVLAHAEFLTLHCPPQSNRQPLLDVGAIARLKQGCFIINTARYDLIDPEAILAALDSGHIAGLALDVFDTEPPTDLRLARHPRVLATPHLGGFTRESIDRAMSVAVENLLAALSTASAGRRLE